MVDDSATGALNFFALSFGGAWLGEAQKADLLAQGGFLF
jgi:hypothetical protein